jgi:deazaflavin-dependent oxidoreductase (nitroreductase family)
MIQNNTKQFTRWHETLLKFLRRLITSSNVWLLKVSKGRLGNNFLGVPVLLLTTTGRKSGQQRTQPLYYLESGDQIVLVASNAGTATDPAWMLNIQANPTVSVDVRGQDRRMKARVASAEEKAELWPQLTGMFPKWQMMEDRSKRSFKVVVLDPHIDVRAMR